MQFNKTQLKFGQQDIIISTGKLAKQANGSVTVVCGGTVVLVTVCMSKLPREGIDFFPLTVEYQEKTYAAGRIPGGFFKREGRPSENEILTARLIDRPIRPLFPKGLYNDVQIMAIVLSSDGENDPDILAVTGASAALSISDIPFNGPLACCRVARLNGNLVLNPTYAQLEKSEFDIVVAANDKGIIMLESKAQEISEELFKEAVAFGFENIKPVLKLQKDFAASYGRPKATVEYKTIDPELLKKTEELSADKLKEVYNLAKKEQREESVDLLSKEIENILVPAGYLPAQIKSALHEIEKKQVRQKIVHDKARVDGRKFNDIRQISCEVGILPRTHGSGLFTRGQTQSLSVTTLGTGDDEQLVEALEGEKSKSFMLHYSFPPFSVGETGPVRGPGRREIGHGALAEKALLAVMPDKEKFPYTTRVVSEILESNGSSSMATVCAASLSLMDAGVPIKSNVSGVALGLIREGGENIVLTDIAGVEDHFGDMDFKVAGTRKGVTAVQMDLKVDYIDLNLLERCLNQAKEARFIILDKMDSVISSARQEVCSYAPRIIRIKVNPEKIGELIGPGGKNIKAIIAATGTTIDIQDDGTVMIGATDTAKAEDAIRMIKAISDDIEVGRIYNGKVKRIMPFGAFCEIAPKKEGLVHVSELSDRFVKNVEEVVKLGDEIKVKVIGIDEMGRINLSKKQADQAS
ncbi:MAG: polyribonucleotide nucleotidyltransferase [Candidatus Omnitrophica bacterium]|jgi:polyribonucleotide nucleotidyltransferase|nr:polyribonucleotide nucleotidyltransferase [Candidatus Omnitrophota bacterium]